MVSKRTLVATLAAASLMAAASAQAKDLVYATFVGSQHSLLQASLGPTFDRIRKATGGEIDWKVHPGGQLLAARAMLPGVRDRLADAGLVVPSFFPAELPYNNVIYDMQMHGEDVVAITGATHEMIANCKPCQDEWRKQNQIFMASYVIPSYVLMCKDKRVASVQDITGRKVNGSGVFGRWLQSVGAVPINISSTESVQAVERGVIDCIGGSISWLKSYGLADVVKHVLDLPMASPRNIALMAVNRSSWQSLSKAQREAIFAEMPMATALASLSYKAADDVARGMAADKKIDLVKPSADWTDAKRKFLASENETLIQVSEKRGVKGAREMIQQYEALLETWSRLSKDIGDDPNKLAKALQERVFSKIDPHKL